ncbi:PREDICTED: protein LTV1 homolog [Chrysochloris asiatica]|uniref:Protein LTV1 homolog n=1 Tax=Chrysochloris asiatica TaxID=185453 RepID=A0A9B0T242_CHRAS|nr:PREDICTED: protein LTV1 homolog [Chrysochloris asiatica]
MRVTPDREASRPPRDENWASTTSHWLLAIVRASKRTVCNFRSTPINSLVIGSFPGRGGVTLFSATWSFHVWLTEKRRLELCLVCFRRRGSRAELSTATTCDFHSIPSKPHRKKKPFIEKKKAVTFHLVHRSQRDPLAADETAPQRVLIPTQKVNDEERRAEQRKYGVFFDDDYDYLQHLKEPSGPSELIPTSFSAHNKRDEKEGSLVIPTTGIQLPSSVFASEFEEDVGLLNKAAPVSGPRLDFDPDIVAALDDDFDFDNPDNLLEDDFILQANKPTGEEEGVDIHKSQAEDDNEWEDVDDAEESGGGRDDYDSDGPLSSDGDDMSASDKPHGENHLFWEEETKSRFTEYSMTSSVMRRNEQLTLHDDRFEKFYEQYDDDEIGALDNAELEGSIPIESSRLQDVLSDYYKEKAENCVKLNILESFEDQDLLMNELKEFKEEEIVTVVLEDVKEKWDCQSICSTYSNLYNHPQLIKDHPKPSKIRISSKTGIPLNVLPKKGLTAKQVERMQMINDSDLPKVSTQPRSKNETKGDKRARKQAIKEERKERRVEKKANKLAFKLEKRRQEKELLNLKKNVEGLKL